MEDWLKCQISPLVKYRQNQTPKLVTLLTRIFCSVILELYDMNVSVYYKNMYSDWVITRVSSFWINFVTISVYVGHFC